MPGRAQNGELDVLRIEVKTPTGPIEYSLELYDLRNHQRIDSAEAHPDGSFTLRHLPYGDYQLSLVDGAGNLLRQQFVTVNGITPPIAIDLTGLSAQLPPGGPISVTQLQHPPTRKAFESMQAAQRFSTAGQYEKAEKELQKAVRLSPYYAEAYANLGVQHIRMNRFQDAETELSRALEIGGPNALVLTNLAAAEVALKRYNDAIQTAGRALQLEPAYPQAHYILGMALCTNNATVREGLRHLRAAAATMPQAAVQIEKVHQALTPR
jgi:tetratricopeptide (TPR) repeat protein